MAYTSFQNCTKQEYENVIYSQQAEHKLILFFNNVELQDADTYCEKFTVKPRIVPNGAKSFSLNNFISKEAELILRDIDTSIIQDQVSISIGTLVNNTYEYVPIGIFNIEDQPTTDKNKTTIKLRDNSVKFDFNYNAEPLITENGGSATKLQILQDICSQANVTCNITSFIGYLDEVGIYDNSITARQYIANIAEQAGKIATINREGELIFIDLNDLTTWEIPLEVVEKYEVGTSYKIGKIVYEDGISRYETEDSNDDTLFLDANNDYIDNSNLIEKATNNNNYYELENTSNEPLKKFELEGKTQQASTPTPDNPSELISVGYINLISVTQESGTYNNLTFTKINDYTFRVQGEAVSYARGVALTNVFPAIYGGEYYTWSAEVVDGTFAGSLPIAIYNTDDTIRYNYFVISLADGLTKTKQVIANHGIYQISYYLPANQSVDVTLKVMFEKGEVAHTPIWKDEYGIGINNIGKNLFDGQLEIGSYNSSGVKITDNNRIRSANFIQVKPNTNYKFSENGVGIPLYIQEYNNNYEFIQRVLRNSQEYLTTTNNTKYITFRTYSETTDTTKKIQLEKGSYATPYEPYKSNTQLYTLDEPLRSIGDTKDLLYIENGILKVKRYIESVILNGSENWVKHSSSGDENRYWLSGTNFLNTFKDIITGSETALLGKLQSNYFQQALFSDTQIGKFSVNNLNQVNWFLLNSAETTIENFKTWLSTHNTEVIYELAEPYIEEIGRIEMPTTYDGITYVLINSNINTTSYIEYLKNITRLDAILQEVNQFSIDSFKTGKILGNPAIDGYDLIEINDDNNTYKTLATNDFTYNGVCTSTYDTQIGEEAKEQNVTFNGEETFKKWARTKIDNVEGEIQLQAGEINETNGRISQTDLTVSSQGVMIDVLSNNSNIDITYDEGGTPLSGEVTAVKTRNKKYSMDENGFKIESSENSFKLLQNETGAYYYDGDTPTGEYTKDGSKQKDLSLFGTYKYGMADYNSTPLFVGQLYENNGEQGFGHFWNGGDINGS